MKKISLLSFVCAMGIAFPLFAQENMTQEEYMQSAEYKCISGEIEKLKPVMQKDCKLTDKQMETGDMNLLNETQQKCVEGFSKKFEEIFNKCQGKK